MASGRQVRLTVDLLDKRGYPTELVSDAHRGLGAGDDSMGCSVAEWVEGLDQRTVASLIDRLFTGELLVDRGRGARDGGGLAADGAAANAAAEGALAPAPGAGRRTRRNTSAPQGAPERR